MTKLVRDFIPEIIKKEGKNAEFYIADNNEFSKRLKDKLLEEVQEYIEDETIEEIADILEVLDAICKFKNFSKERLNIVKKQKFESRGGFSKKLVIKGSSYEEK